MDFYGAVAQRTESAVSTRLVGGLNPSSPAIYIEVEVNTIKDIYLMRIKP